MNLKKGDVMYYELYVDSLFLVNFVMNLYLLLLTNRSVFRTATRKRLILGAALGAIFSLLPFLRGGPQWIRMVLGIPGSTIVMIVVAFRVNSIRAFLEIAEKLLLYSILLGGTMLLVVKKIPWLEVNGVGLSGVLGMGAILYLWFWYLAERKAGQNSCCRVTLANGTSRITVRALIDSGNSLIEPISGKPVSIVEKDVIYKLWEKEPELYRAIPYHSIGKKHGILKGYCLPEMKIEINGVTKICKDVYIAVCEEYVTSHEKMILHPDYLTEAKEIRKKRKNMSKERYGYYYDIKSGSSG
uniref:sigma-E processing peptidase SpoIIGA n=1 Tax=Acetatifactor sp. TaxID=1872090 RepID=UPI004055D57F